MSGTAGLRFWLTEGRQTFGQIPGSILRRYRARPLRTTAQVSVLLAVVLYPVLYTLVLVPLGRVTFPLPVPDLTGATFMIIFAILSLGLNMVVGLAGLLDLGYVAFYAIGAYVAAFLASPHWSGMSIVLFSDAASGSQGLHISFFILIWVAAIVAAVAGATLGAPTLRLRGDYLAIVTLAFGEIVPVVFRNLDAVSISLGPIQIVDANITGGALGINPIDQPNLFGIEFGAVSGGNAYWLGLVLIVVVLVFSRNLTRSRLGRAWMAIREDERAARMMGVNTVRTKLLAFAMGAAIGGVGGAFQASYLGATSSDFFQFSTSILVLCMVILGGMGNARGVLVGGALLQWVNLTLLVWLGDRVNDIGRVTGIPVLADLVLARYNFLLFGLLLVVMMNVRPEGLIPNRQRQAEFHEDQPPDMASRAES